MNIHFHSKIVPQITMLCSIINNVITLRLKCMPQNSEDLLKQAQENYQALQEGFRAESPNVLSTDTSATPVSALSDITVDLVATMFPPSARKNIETYLPAILKTFVEIDFTDKTLVLMALATIRAESAGFQPLSEFKSKFNTSPGGQPFDRYDNRSDLGNRGKPDGERYRGHGFIQLTGRANYEKYSQLLGLGTQLVDNPDLANDAAIAAKILALFIRDKEKLIGNALAKNDLAKARKLVNGGSHGLKEFSEAFNIGKESMLT